MTDAERAALTEERETLERKLAKRKDQPGFAANAAEIEARISEIDQELAADV